MAAKSNCSFNLLQCIQTRFVLFCFIPKCWNFSSGNLECCTALLSVDDFPRRCSSGVSRPRLRGTQINHSLLWVPQPVLRLRCLSPNTPVSKAPSGSLAVWCWVPQICWRHLCSRVDATFLLSGLQGYETRVPVLPWC